MKLQTKQFADRTGKANPPTMRMGEGREGGMMIEFIWTGKRWWGPGWVFRTLQGYLSDELAGYGGELWNL